MKCLEDRLKDVVGSGHYVKIPKSQDTKALRAQELVSAQIVRCLIDMLTAIEFHDDGDFKTNEIADIVTNRMLSTKFVSV